MFIYNEFLDTAGQPIVDMNADWTSKDYEFGDNNMICIQFGWSNIAILGDIILEYSADKASDADGVTLWEEKNRITLDGLSDKIMILDALLPVVSFSIRYVRLSGDADIIKPKIVVKRA